MTTNEQTTPAFSEQQHLGHWVVARHGPLSLALFVAAALFAALTVYQIVRELNDKDGLLPLAFWSLILALTTAAGGCYLSFRVRRATEVPEGEPVVVAFLIVALAGLATLLVLGLGLPFGPWSEAFVPPAPAAEAGTTGTEAAVQRVPLLKVWRDNAGRLAVVAAAVVGGLVLMFLGVLPLRQLERQNASLRRILRGYNAVLNSLLLLIIFALLNILSYVHLPPFTAFARDIDWTRSGVYTLNPASVNILSKEVNGEVRLIALMPESDPATEDLRRLVRSCQPYHSQISLTVFEKGKLEYEEALKNLSKYIKREPRMERAFAHGFAGVVVLYTRPGEVVGEFIFFPDLYTESRDGHGRFRGENELMRVLRKLTQKEPTRVYFTTGHGEIGFDEPKRDDPGLDDVTATWLKQALTARGPYEFRTVKLGPTGGPDLREADVVVVARPTEEFGEKAAEVLRQYMNPPAGAKKGKLILLVDVQHRNGKLQPTGLEGLLAQYNVEIGSERLLSHDPRVEYPGLVVVQVPQNGQSGLAQALANERRGYYLAQPRRMQPGAAGNRQYRVAPLLINVSRAWVESDLKTDPLELTRRHWSATVPEDKQPELVRGAAVAVTVAEVAPNAAGAGPLEVPRMIVFGSASWLTSQGHGGAIAEEQIPEFRSIYASFLDNSITWLRGKDPPGADVALPRETGQFSLSKRADLEPPERRLRLMWLPLLYIVLGLVALGGGIWLVRRR